VELTCLDRTGSYAGVLTSLYAGLGQGGARHRSDGCRAVKRQEPQDQPRSTGRLVSATGKRRFGDRPNVYEIYSRIRAMDSTGVHEGGRLFIEAVFECEDII